MDRVAHQHTIVNTPALEALIPGQQWVCFNKEKAPISPVTLKGVSGVLVEGNTDWTSHEAALTVWKANDKWIKGIGREFIKKQGITGIDLDDCIDENGNIAPWAQAEIDRLNSYTEISPSGDGVHIWVYGNIPNAIAPAKPEPDGYEMYDCGRYFTITSRHLPGTPTTIEDRHEEVLQLHSEIVARRKKQETREQTTPGIDSPYGRKALQDECRNVALAGNGSRNDQLNRSAYALGQLVGGGVLSRSTVERDLYDAAMACGLGHSETVKTMRSGLDKGELEPRTPPAKEHPQYSAEPGANGNGNGHHQQPVDEQPGSFNRTDLGNAERFAAQYRDRVRWCDVWNSWIVFNGKAWEQDKTGQADRLAKATVRSIYGEAEAITDDTAEGKAERQRLAKHAVASESNRAVRAMLDRAKSELPAMPEEFNAYLHLLNCKNGTIDLRTGELRPHNPADMLTRCLKINYNPHAPFPKWLQFIQFIFAGDISLIDFLQQALGMSLSGDVSEQCLFICHGAGSNGKTTLLETVRIILAAYGLAANIETFQVHKGEHIMNDVAELYGARFVTASENALGSRLNEAFIKKATGNEPLRARRLHENEFQFMPECTLWFAVNHKPVVKDTTKGMWRRVHFIPFAVTIESDQIDKHLGKKLLEESEGILAWLVQGCITWYQQGRLNVPKIVREATQAYRAEMDVIARFLDERCNIAPLLEIGATPLFEAYKAWCDTNGERWESQKNFGSRLTERGYEKVKTRIGYVYHGIALQDVNDVTLVDDNSDKPLRRKNTSEKHTKNGSQGSHRSQESLFHTGQRVNTPKGPGTVMHVFETTRTVKVGFSPGVSVSYPFEQVTEVQA